MTLDENMRHNTCYYRNNCKKILKGATDKCNQCDYYRKRPVRFVKKFIDGEIIEGEWVDWLKLNKTQTAALRKEMQGIFHVLTVIENVDYEIDRDTLDKLFMDNGVSSMSLCKFFLRLGIDID